MLIKITNFCSMGCSHCLEDSTVAGQHMTRETFLAALELTERLEGLSWERGVPKILLISGGEATEHPDIEWFLETALAAGYRRLLITNGMWLDNPELRAKILRPDWTDLLIQVTNDPRFYPSAPKGIPTDDPRVMFVPSLTVLVTLGRLKRSRLPQGPSSSPWTYLIQLPIANSIAWRCARSALRVAGPSSRRHVRSLLAEHLERRYDCRGRILKLFSSRQRALQCRGRYPCRARHAVQQMRPG